MSIKKSGKRENSLGRRRSGRWPDGRPGGLRGDPGRPGGAVVHRQGGPPLDRQDTTGCWMGRQTWTRRASGEDLLDDLAGDVGEAEVAAVVAVRELLVV